MKFNTASFFFQSSFHIGKCFSISRRLPGGCNFPVIKSLRPPTDLLRKWEEGSLSDERYIGIYEREVLAKTSVSEILREVLKRGEVEEVTLCCWERDGAFCHRKIVAEWLQREGMEVEGIH